MITMIMYAKIRRMFFREHVSISEIGRRTSLSHNAIKKCLRAPDGTEPTYCRAKSIVKFSTFDELNAWLEVRCRTLWATIEHPDHVGITIAVTLEQEQAYLMPMPIPV